LAITPPDRDDATLAAPWRERIVRRGLFLQRMGADHREVTRGRQQVIGQGAGQELAFENRKRDAPAARRRALHDGADGLAMQGQRIDDAATSSTAM